MTPVKGPPPAILLFATSSTERFPADNMLWSQFGRQPYHMFPGTGASTYWRVFRRRRDGVIKSLDYPEVKHAELHPGRVFGAVRLTRTLPEASAQERRDARWSTEKTVRWEPR